MANLFNLRIYNAPEGLQRRLNVFAAKRGVPMSKVAIKALEEYMAKCERAGGRRNRRDLAQGS